MAVGADQHAHRPMFWYPNVNNHSDSAYIYLSSLQTDNEGVYKKAENLLSQALSQNNITYNLSNLKALADREAAKEDAFLNEHYRTTSTNPRQDAERIKAFNDMYQYEAIFARNLAKIKELDSGETKSGKIDITSVYRGYLEGCINKLFTDRPIDSIEENDIKQAIEQSVIEMFNSKDERWADNEEALRSYQELLQNLQTMQQMSPLVDDIFDIYFGTTIEKIRAAVKEQKTTKQGKPLTAAQKAVKQDRGLHGSLLEAISGYSIGTMIEDIANKPNIHVDGLKGKQKTDISVIYGAEIELPTLTGFVDGSVRQEMIQRMQNFYNNLQEEKGYIVEISAKNYDLSTPYFKDGGFTAQGPTTIENFQKTMNQYGYDKARVDALVYALINIGPDTLSQDTSELCKNISTLIGYFLFDDINMDLKGNVQGVHLFNLNGIYIPLSVFLQKAYQTINKFEGNPGSYVHVNYKPESVDYQRTNMLTQDYWEFYRQKKMKQDGLSFHFFRDFTQYIANLGF